MSILSKLGTQVASVRSRPVALCRHSDDISTQKCEAVGFGCRIQEGDAVESTIAAKLEEHEIAPIAWSNWNVDGRRGARACGVGLPELGGRKWLRSQLSKRARRERVVATVAWTFPRAWTTAERAGWRAIRRSCARAARVC